jgi:hypothetical protein
MVIDVAIIGENFIFTFSVKAIKLHSINKKCPVLSY